MVRSRTSSNSTISPSIQSDDERVLDEDLCWIDDISPCRELEYDDEQYPTQCLKTTVNVKELRYDASLWQVQKLDHGVVLHEIEK